MGAIRTGKVTLGIIKDAPSVLLPWVVKKYIKNESYLICFPCNFALSIIYCYLDQIKRDVMAKYL